MEIIGVDWSGARDAGRKVWLCVGSAVDGRLEVASLERVADAGPVAREAMLAHVADRLTAPGERWVGLDLPVSLPHAVLPEGVTNGGDLARRWTALFPDAEAFRRLCSEAVGGTESHRRERMRAGDTEIGAPFCAWNLRMYRQTHHGMRMIGEVLRSGRAALLPWDAPRPVRLLEACPACTLRALGLSNAGYKGRTAQHAQARRDRLDRALAQLPVLLPADLRDRAIADPGGDALDAVLAAAAAHHASTWPAARHAALRRGAPEAFVHTGVPAR